ncbi:MAG: hypothetical protein LBL73_09805 [Synergistaceae bacterium]|jgi:hypothetical protein|nr:hypothetical protein [Synergistaceae bacterium]
MPSWDRQTGESEVAYEAFRAFLALEGKRSFRLVGKRLAKSSTIINKWAKLNRWLDRALDYDSNKEKLLLKTEIEEEKKRRRKITAREHETGAYIEGTIRKALTRLNARLDNDPKFLIPPKDIVAMANLGFELQKTEFREHADERTGRKGMLALAESINALAERTLERHGQKPRDGKGGPP